MPENTNRSKDPPHKLSPARQHGSPKTAPSVNQIGLLLEQREEHTHAPTRKMAQGAVEVHRRKSRSASSPGGLSQDVSLSDIAFSMDFEDEVLEFTGWTLSLDAKSSRTH